MSFVELPDERIKLLPEVFIDARGPRLFSTLIDPSWALVGRVDSGGRHDRAWMEERKAFNKELSVVVTVRSEIERLMGEKRRLW